MPHHSTYIIIPPKGKGNTSLEIYLNEIDLNLIFISESQLSDFLKLNQQLENEVKNLTGIYTEWQSIMPFELDFFETIRPFFYRGIPILKKNKPPVFHSKATLTRSLISVTDYLLKTFNGNNLHEKGLISDTDKHQMNLIKQERKQQINAGYFKDANKEQFDKAITGWLRHEQEFWRKMTPFLSEKTEIPKNQVKQKPGRKKTEPKPLEQYLINVSNECSDKFIQSLKEYFLSSTPKEFVHMIKALEVKKLIYFETREEIYQSFQNYFGKTYGSTTAKNNNWSNIDRQLLERTISKINSIKQEKIII